jgi:prevent-host-death family protein
LKLIPAKNTPKGNGGGQERLPNPFLDIAISNSYHGPMQVSVADAKNKLPELIRAVEDGEPVIICRRGVPVVEIVRTKKPARKKRTLGTLKGKIQVLDPNWWKPMTDDEVQDLLAGRS